MIDSSAKSTGLNKSSSIHHCYSCVLVQLFCSRIELRHLGTDGFKMSKESTLQSFHFLRHCCSQVLRFSKIILQIKQLHRPFEKLDQLPVTFPNNTVGPGIMPIMREMPKYRIASQLLLALGTQVFSQRKSIDVATLR